MEQWIGFEVSSEVDVHLLVSIKMQARILQKFPKGASLDTMYNYFINMKLYNSFLIIWSLYFASPQKKFVVTNSSTHLKLILLLLS